MNIEKFKTLTENEMEVLQKQLSKEVQGKYPKRRRREILKDLENIELTKVLKDVEIINGDNNILIKDTNEKISFVGINKLKCFVFQGNILLSWLEGIIQEYTKNGGSLNDIKISYETYNELGEKYTKKKGSFIMGE